MTSQSIHACAVRAGDTGLLIRGPSGSGKSRLCLELILAGRSGQIPSCSLIADDRTFLEARSGVVIARPAPELKGLIEVRGLGIRSVDFIAVTDIHAVIDLAAQDCDRMPTGESLRTELLGLSLPRIPIGPKMDARFTVLAYLVTRSA